MEWYSRYLYSIVLSILNVHSSAVVLKNEPLNWREANEACQLINFSQVKTEYKTFIKEMVEEKTATSNSGYWIQDAVTEFSVVNKGCQKNVPIVESTTIEKNMLSNCFQFCRNNANLTTIGVKGNNCSCLNSTASDTNLPIDGCDILCVWEDRLCEMATVFSVFERQDSIDTLAGYRVEECIAIRDNVGSRLNCLSKNAYICQKNGNLNEFSDKVTWMEALSKCAEQNQTLAYYQPSSYKFNNIRSRAYRNWIGIRQFYQTEPVKQGSRLCPVIRRYNNDDMNVEYSNCGDNKKYICLKENIDQDSSSGNAVGTVIGVLVTVAILLLVLVCLFKRRRNNSRSAYQSPVVEYSNEQRRDSKHSQTKSVKSSPLKPARRSKKATPDSLVSGTEYENIVLTFEDPSTISRVVSSTSTDRTEILKEEENYDVMNTGNNETSSNVTSQNVYGFSPPEGEYDVMNRGNRNVNEFNPNYDHM